MPGVPPLDLTILNSDRYKTVEPEAVSVRSFFGRYKLFFYGFVAGVAATVVGSKMCNALDSHSSKKYKI
jgi:hypothetical protein